MNTEFFERMRVARVPFAGSLEVTHRCNLSCAHCYQFPSRPGEMNTGQIVRLLGQLSEAGCLFLNVTGGEPLLRPDILDIMRAASERHFALALQTNALLLDEGMADELARLRALRVDLSLHAAEEGGHDGFTGVPGSFNACLRALELLKERGIPAMTKTSVTTLNVGELDGIAALAEERGAPAFFSPMIYPANDGGKGPLRYRLSDAQLEGFMDFQLHRLVSVYGSLEAVERLDVVNRPPGCGEAYPDVRGRLVRGCGAGKTTFCVNPYGDIYPCVAWPCVVGNVLEGDFMTVWRESPLLAEVRQKEFNLDEECASCRLLERCSICRALSYTEDGDAQALNRERCRQTRIWVGRIEDGRD